MRIGMPQMGNVYIPFKALFEELGVDYVMPPANNQRALTLGVQNSPEGLCLPFKLTLGNLIEAAEKGADTLLMPGVHCRLGYYATTQEQILREMGYNVEIVRVSVWDKKLPGLLRLIKRLSNNATWPRIISAFRFGLAKLNSVDSVEKLVQRIRAVETTKGTANKLYAGAIRAIDDASDYRSLKIATSDYTARLKEVPCIDRKPLVVGVTGEFYVLLEPFSNLDVEIELGKLGVEVRRRLFISDWTRFSFFLNALGINETARIHKAAMPYLKRDIGGDGWESVGDKVLHAGEYNGLVHLAPFTCMPEIVAQNIMPSTRESIPVLTIICDEQATKTGMLTRLEAFVDLLERRRRAQYSGRTDGYLPRN